MIVAFCPRCAESIRVPSAKLPDDAYANCPICRETFLASDLLDRLPPLVQFTGADGLPLEVNEPSHSQSIGRPFDSVESDHSAAAVASGAMESAALAAGGLAAGAVALGAAAFGAEQEETELLAENELAENELGENNVLQDTFTDETLDDSEVEEYLDEVAEVDELEDDEDATGSTVLMDTLTNEDGGYADVAADETEVDVDAEVQHFLDDDESDEDGDAPIQFQPDSDYSDNDYLETDSELETEPQSFGSDDLVVEDVALEPVVASQPAIAPMKVRSRPTPQRKKTSPVKTLLSVAMGPVIALPLAGGLLLAIGKAPDLGFWPFDGKGNASTERVASATPGSPFGSTSGSMPSAVYPDRRNTFGQPSALVGPEDSSEDLALGNDDGLMDDQDDDTASDLDALSSPPIDPSDSTPSDLGNEAAASENSTLTMPPDIEPAANDPSAPDNDMDRLDTPKLPAATDPATTDDTQTTSPGVVSGKPPVEADALADANANASFDDDKSTPAANDSATLDSILGMADASDATSETAGFDDPFGDGNAKEVPANEAGNESVTPDKMKNAAADSTSDQPEMLRGTTAVESQDDGPFGKGVSLDGPAIIDSPELTAASEKAGEAIEVLLTKRADGTAKNQDIGRAYAAICQVGMFDSNSKSNAVRKLLIQVGQSTLLDDFGGATAKTWLGLSRRPSDGILLIGTMGGPKGERHMLLSNGLSVSVSVVEGSHLPKNGSRTIGIGAITDKNTAVLNAAYPIN